MRNLIKNAVNHAVATRQFDGIASYLLRGRHLAMISNEDLQLEWAAALAEFIVFVDDGRQRRHDDAIAEIDLRKLKSDLELLRTKWDTLHNRIQSLSTREVVRFLEQTAEDTGSYNRTLC